MKSAFALRTMSLLLAGGVTLTVVLLGLAQQTPAPKAAPRLSGPYTHDNLTIFLIHGQDQMKVKDLLTLPEALEQKKAVIHETQSVNQLSVENLSASEEVLMLAGDILKGGQQDRFAQNDMLVAPKSGKVALSCFCVELTAARWMRPLTAEDKKFGGSPGQVTSNSLRIAGRLEKNQSKVWDKVRDAQRMLSTNAGVSVNAAASESSLALSLQVKEVREARDRYVKKLQPVIEDHKDVIGYAFAINGKVYCADSYGASALFRKVWPRLIEASAIEAFADLQKDKKFEPVTAAAVQAFLLEAEKGKTSTEEVGKLRCITRDNALNCLFESQDGKSKGIIRRSILAH